MKRALSVAAALCATVGAAAYTVIDRLPLATQEPALRQRAADFLNETRPDFPEWQDARIAADSYPLYRPDIAEVAYYEFPVVAGADGAPAGYVLLSRGLHDMQIVHWSTKGKSNVQQLVETANVGVRKGDRYYLLDIFSFAVEDERGNLMGQLGEHRVRRANWPVFKRDYAATYERKLRALREYAARDWERPKLLFGKGWCGKWKRYWAGSEADQRRYRQIAPGVDPNTEDCWSGCGPTAWAMLFGWADTMASQNDPVWGASWGTYGDQSVVAPRGMDAGVRDMTWEIRGFVETQCGFLRGLFGEEEGLTWPWDMAQAGQYLRGAGTARNLTVEHTTLGIPEIGDGLRDKADQHIRDGEPVVIALGWEHYALAWGYRKKNCRFGRDKHDFYINDGYGSDRWTNAGVWFVGQIDPADASAPLTCSSPGQKCCHRLCNGLCTACIPADSVCPSWSTTPFSGCPGRVCCEAGVNRCQTCAASCAECPIVK